MKSTIFKTYLAALMMSVMMTTTAHGSFQDFLSEDKESTNKVTQKIKKEVAELDLKFRLDLGDIDLISGVNLAAKYHYDVSPSYLDKYYTRIDKWDLKTGINVGEIIEDLVDLPFSFSVSRQRSFYFVRQFKDKEKALKSFPYTPKQLPLNAELALKNLNVGDFVSMPANLNISVSAGASTLTVAPVVLNAGAQIYWIISGEFIIQVFKVDETHVRLKLISRNSYGHGVSAAANVSFKFFGVKVLDRQVDRLLDRDLVGLGYRIEPGSQFIVDYVFDLKNAEAQDAYNQILRASYKFKDLAVIAKNDNAMDLKDKLLSTFEKADAIFNADKTLDYKDRRVSRIFKGFSNYKSKIKNIKFSLLVARFQKDYTYTENKITYIDKNEKNVEFFYPSYSEFRENKFGKSFFDVKDQTFQNNFGIIPRLNSENINNKVPDYGITFERKDRYFRKSEQLKTKQFIVAQLPPSFENKVDLTQWKDGQEQKSARVFFQLILKSQGYKLLKNYSNEEINKRLIEYISKNKVLASNETHWQEFKDNLNVSRYLKGKKLIKLGNELYKIFQNNENDSELMLKKLVQLNEDGAFDKIGIGFLISLLPQDQLESMIYLKLEVTAIDMNTIKFEFGALNNSNLYKELVVAQSRIADRSYDLRVTEGDHESAEEELENFDQ